MTIAGELMSSCCCLAITIRITLMVLGRLWIIDTRACRRLDQALRFARD